MSRRAGAGSGRIDGASGERARRAGTGPLGGDLANHDTGSSIGGVQYAADGVVQRGLGVEAGRSSVSEPADESIDEAAEPVARIPLA